MTFVSTAMVIPASLKDRKKKISGNGIVSWEEWNFCSGKQMSDVPEYVEISGKWLAAEGELREYRDQCLKQGMELMTKYFRNLWD